MPKRRQITRPRTRGRSRRPEVSGGSCCDGPDATGPHEFKVSRPVIVGSADRADHVVIADPTVSRLHLALEPRKDGLWFRDLGSRNHTYLAGRLVNAGRLFETDQLQLGKSITISITPDKSEVSQPMWRSPSFRRLVGQSPAMRALFWQIHKAAEGNVAVLIHGETGTGKEDAAKTLHEESDRKGGPFVVVDCGSLPEHLIEAELFGHAKGAFTGAVGSRAGAIAEAEGGTVFLDEIGELPLAMQPRLLRALESKTIRRVGETRHREVNVRFVAATHRNLPEMVNAGIFREDLFFRLSVVSLEIPPLRSHSDDIPILVDHIIEHQHGRVRPEGIDDVLGQLQAIAVGGQRSRALKNFVERASRYGAAEALAMQVGATAARRVETSDALRARQPESLGSFNDARERAIAEVEVSYLAAQLQAPQRRCIGPSRCGRGAYPTVRSAPHEEARALR